MTFNSGYLCTRGEENSYQEGGFYAVAPSGAIIDLEKDIEEGDFSLGLGSLKHGVARIDPSFSKPVDWSGDRGRWWIGLYSNDSDYVMNRVTTMPETAE